MPELPDITVYVEALEQRIGGARLERYRLVSPFLLRSVEPPLDALVGARVVSVERLGKRIVIGFEHDLYLVIHLMIAGRLQWRADRPKKQVPNTQLVLELDTGTLFLTEAGTKRRASLYVVRGRAALAEHDRGGLEVAAASAAEFRAALTRGNHTLKRALTDPRLLSGIGNAYSDEILHRARLSPVTLTSKLTEEEYARLHAATLAVLAEWTARLRAQTDGEFPSKVTAFHDEMAVHGRYGKPCPVCGTKVQRIRYADNETNYCPRCQTGGRLLADRSLSRLLKKDWPRSIDELERMQR
ncbi:MAG TPA: DNA-formamidopyrimidine glycosylase family protein [Gammaproteobacteria bacterium]|nr:DNA-formamidopyrimidine glycosylase family protein [Gammaproteobacteria bacterium]